MRYLTVSEVAWINEQEVGPHMVRDHHLLESAVARPQSSAFGQDAYPDVHTKAAALCQSLACNHPFLDGNKRTATLAVIAFYNLNGYRFVADHTSLLHDILDVATSVITEVEVIADRLSKWAAEIDESDLGR